MSDTLPFHEWKNRFREKEKPVVRDPYEYYRLYGEYCKRRISQLELVLDANDIAIPEPPTE